MLRLPRWVRRAVLCALVASSTVLSYPHIQASQSGVVISEFRVRGPNGGSDEFVELYNAGPVAVNIGGWKIGASNNAGTTGTRATIAAGRVLNPGCFYLLTNSSTSGGPYSGSVAGDQTYGTGITDDGGLAILTSADVVVDAVGLSGGSAYREGTPLASLGSTNLDRGYERRPGGSAGHATDTDDNSGDFVLIGPTRPQSSASPCISTTTPSDPSGSATANPASVNPGDTTLLTVAVTAGTNPTSTGITVTGDLAAIGGSSAQPLFDDGTNGDAIAGDMTYSYAAVVLASTSPGLKSLTFTIADAQARMGTASASVNVIDPTPPAFDVAISQVYGGGGNLNTTYTHDFIELFNRGTTAVNLAGWSVQYNGAANDGTWQVTPLTGTLHPGRYYLVRQATGGGGTTPLPSPDAIGTIPMSANNGKVALVTTTSPFAGRCPAGATLVDLVGFGSANCWEGAAATPALAAATAALRKRGGCFDSNNNNDDFIVGSPTPRNSASPVRSCDYLTLPIHAIQGTDLVSPYAGQDVTTTGVVTALKTNGFFMQTPDHAVDGDPATSEGLFVFTGSLPAAVTGDLVNVRGTAGEFFNLTQVEATLAGDVAVISTENTIPSAVTLTASILAAQGVPAQLERLEGMRVHAPALVSVAPTNEFGEIYAVLSGVARPLREPGIEFGLPIPPDPVTGTVDCCIPIWDRNPERIMVDSDGVAGAMAIYVTSGVMLTGVTGPLDFSFSNYKILPAAPPAVSENLTAMPVPPPAANEFTVGSYNIENFNNNDTQRRKAALHVRTVMRSPDVIGVIEIGSLAALQALALQVNDDAVAAGEPNPQYQAQLIPFTGTQHVGFLIKTSRVAIHGVTQERATDTFINPNTGNPETLHDRPPLVLNATIDPAGDDPARVLVVVNHLRSFIDAGLVSGEGPRVRAKRTAQAESVAGLLQELQQNNPGVLVISVGDYNAYQFSDGYTDPISVLKGQPTPGDQIVVAGSPDLVDPDYRNLTEALTPDQQYSFIFEGTPQALDHVLVNTVAYKYFQRYALARSNADFPDVAAAGLLGNPLRPEANSDHDSPVAYFTFPGRPVVTLNGGASMTVEAFTTFADPGATAQDDDGPIGVTVTGTVNVNVPGTYTLFYTASNAHASTTVQRIVYVKDTVAPAIAGFTVSPNAFGPPTHEMFSVIAAYSPTDASGSVSCALSVTSNEPLNSTGDGNTETDWLVMSPTLVQLRAERSGRGTGRVYTITVTCSDPSGNASSTNATVTIAK